MRQQVDHSVDTLRAQHTLNGGRHTHLYCGGKFNPLFLTNCEFQPDRCFLPLDPLKRFRLGMHERLHQKQRHAQTGSHYGMVRWFFSHGLLLLLFLPGIYTEF